MSALLVDMLTKGLRISGEISKSDWLRLGRELAIRGRGWQWQVGDWWNIRDGSIDSEALAVLEDLGVDIKTVQNWAAVCRAIPLEERVDGLSLSHHREVVSLEPERRRALLQMALENGWTVSELRERVRREKARLARVEVKLDEEDEEAPKPRARRGERWEEPEYDEVPVHTPPAAVQRPQASGEVVPSPDGDGYEHARYPETKVIVRQGRILLWNPTLRMTPEQARGLAAVLLFVAQLVEEEAEVRV